MVALVIAEVCGQSYKAPTIVIYVYTILNISILLVSTTLES